MWFTSFSRNWKVLSHLSGLGTSWTRKRPLARSGKSCHGAESRKPETLHYYVNAQRFFGDGTICCRWSNEAKYFNSNSGRGIIHIYCWNLARGIPSTAHRSALFRLHKASPWNREQVKNDSRRKTGGMDAGGKAFAGNWQELVLVLMRTCTQ